MTNFKPGIIICSRLDSERIPNKVLKKLNGVTIIEHLINQLKPLGVPIVVAIPAKQREAYSAAIKHTGVKIYVSQHSEDPLARMTQVQKEYEFTHVVRVTHDKIFVDTEILKNALAIAQHSVEKPDYIYSDYLTPGTGFEVISAKCLQEAASKHVFVEHITYAVRLYSKLSLNLITKKHPFNLLIDFPEDLKLMEVIFATLGSNITLKDVVKYLSENDELKEINRTPILTIYTCAYNAEKFIDECMESANLELNSRFEYIIVDDHSTDRTYEKIARFTIEKNRKNIHWFRNEKNLGLASSSNFALSRARGEFIVRLDADDKFCGMDKLWKMIDYAKQNGTEALYPDNYFGSFDKIQKGNEKHHVGGTLFQKKALNFLKFTEGLRNHDSLDLFVRAKDKLKIGYFESPTFFYTQREDSMSKTNLKERAKIEAEIKGLQ